MLASSQTWASIPCAARRRIRFATRATLPSVRHHWCRLAVAEGVVGSSQTNASEQKEQVRDCVPVLFVGSPCWARISRNHINNTLITQVCSQTRRLGQVSLAPRGGAFASRHGLRCRQPRFALLSIKYKVLLIQDEQKEPTQKAGRLTCLLCWLPLLGSNQRHPD